MRTASHYPLIAACLTLAGCSAGVQAPSLMPRAVEKQPIDLPVGASVEPERPADSALQARIAKQIAAAEAGDKSFETQRAIAETAAKAAAGAAPGSEAWVQAQEAVTALESPRLAVRDAATAIDALRDDPANASAGNRAAIDAAAARVGAIESRETAAVAALVAKLG